MRTAIVPHTLAVTTVVAALLFLVQLQPSASAAPTPPALIRRIKEAAASVSVASTTPTVDQLYAHTLLDPAQYPFLKGCAGGTVDRRLCDGYREAVLAFDAFHRNETRLLKTLVRDYDKNEELYPKIGHFCADFVQHVQPPQNCSELCPLPVQGRILVAPVCRYIWVLYDVARIMTGSEAAKEGLPYVPPNAVAPVVGDVQVPADALPPKPAVSTSAAGKEMTKTATAAVAAAAAETKPQAAVVAQTVAAKVAAVVPAATAVNGNNAAGNSTNKAAVVATGNAGPVTGAEVATKSKSVAGQADASTPVQKTNSAAAAEPASSPNQAVQNLPIAPSHDETGSLAGDFGAEANIGLLDDHDEDDEAAAEMDVLHDQPLQKEGGAGDVTGAAAGAGATDDGADSDDDLDADGNVVGGVSNGLNAGNEPTVQRDPFVRDEESSFFTYFMFVLVVCVAAYVLYHNRRLLFALLLEGRRRNGGGGAGGVGRRKHTAAYRKLDTNLEEAIMSSTDGSAASGRSSQPIIY